MGPYLNGLGTVFSTSPVTLLGVGDPGGTYLPRTSSLWGGVHLDFIRSIWNFGQGRL